MRRPLGIVAALLILGALALWSVTPDRPADAVDNVAILVIDDFGRGRSGNPVELRTANCTLSTQDVISGGAGENVPMPHGVAVYQVVAQELNRIIPAGTPVSRGTTIDWTYRFEGKKHIVRLDEVHTYQYSTQDIFAGIKAKIDALQHAADGPKFSRFVLNLSFVVIPCDVMAWLDSNSLPRLLTTYNTMLQGDTALLAALEPWLKASRVPLNTVEGEIDPVEASNPKNPLSTNLLLAPALASMRPHLVTTFYELLAASTDLRTSNLRAVNAAYEDSFWKAFFLDTQAAINGTSDGRPKMIAVAAAGNGVQYGNGKQLVRKGLTFPFAPGMWEFVVSASMGGPDYNSGEVQLDGAGPLGTDSKGSSFAAARLSARQALYLVETGLTECDGHSPPLKYVDMKTTVDVSTSLSSPWKNFVGSRWREICQAMNQR